MPSSLWEVTLRNRDKRRLGKVQEFTDSSSPSLGTPSTQTPDMKTSESLEDLSRRYGLNYLADPAKKLGKGWQIHFIPHTTPSEPASRSSSTPEEKEPDQQ